MASRALSMSSLKCKVQRSLNNKFVTFTYTFRKCSSAVVETDEVDTKSKQGYARDAYKNERDVPMLLLPHTSQKALHVHPTSTTLPKIFDKYKWVSKTISTPGLPSHHVTNIANESENNEILKGFHDSLFHSVAYVKAIRNQKRPRYIPERIYFSMLSNFLRLSMYYGDDVIHVRPENSFLYHEPLLETHWFRNYKFFTTKFRPSLVLRTRDGFDTVEEPRAITSEEIERMPGPYDQYAMNVYERDIIHLLNKPGMDNAKVNPIKHCHTSIVQENRMVKDEQFLAMGVMTCFSQLAAQAQAAGVLHGTELKKPLVTQCIVTDGHKMFFMVYQLNTLYMLDDKGLWNRCWYSPVMEMFERRDNPHVYMVYEDAETGDELKGFNQECFRLFINFIRRNTVSLIDD